MCIGENKMITLILSYDEACKIGRHVSVCSPYIFTDTRFMKDGEEFEEDLEIIFKEDDRGMCKVCGNFIEECECGGD